MTCLYRGIADSWAARSEALGISTEFAPSVLVARLLGQAEFALGSTMVFRAGTLRQLGGFEAIADYLADDYQLGRRISRLGYRIEFAPVVVETDLGGESWAETWRHQLRWSRTIRVSRPAGYFGYVVTHATFWALVALAAGEWWAAALALGLRMVAGMVVGVGVLQRPSDSEGFLADAAARPVRICGLAGRAFRPYRPVAGSGVALASGRPNPRGRAQPGANLSPLTPSSASR